MELKQAFSICRDQSGAIVQAETKRLKGSRLMLKVRKGPEERYFYYCAFDFIENDRTFLTLTAWMSLAHQSVIFRASGELEMRWIMNFRGYHRTHKAWVHGNIWKDEFAGPYYQRLHRQLTIISPEYWMTRSTRKKVSVFAPVFKQILNEHEKAFEPYEKVVNEMINNSPDWSLHWPTFCHAAGSAVGAAVGGAVGDVPGAVAGAALGSYLGDFCAANPPQSSGTPPPAPPPDPDFSVDISGQAPAGYQNYSPPQDLGSTSPDASDDGD